jgi:hypothetical protein
MNDYEQLARFEKWLQSAAGLTRAECELVAEQRRHAETRAQLDGMTASFAEALEALDRIANTPVNGECIALELQAMARAAWGDVVGVDDARRLD